MVSALYRNPAERDDWYRAKTKVEKYQFNSIMSMYFAALKTGCFILVIRKIYANGLKIIMLEKTVQRKIDGLWS